VEWQEKLLKAWEKGVKPRVLTRNSMEGRVKRPDKDMPQIRGQDRDNLVVRELFLNHHLLNLLQKFQNQ
jgi:hypothetical protein